MSEIADVYGEHLLEVFNREIALAKRQTIEQDRHFFIATGARQAVRALLEAGVFTEDFAPSASEWLKKGGIAHLVVSGVNIVPPDYTS